MTDENKSETEVETQDFEDKIEELEKELAQKDEEIEKLQNGGAEENSEGLLDKIMKLFGK